MHVIACSFCAKPAEVIATFSDGDRPACGGCLVHVTCDVRDLPRLGNLMWHVVWHVRVCPGLTHGQVARDLATVSTVKVIHTAIGRCVRAGLVESRQLGNRRALHLTHLGVHTSTWQPAAR